ncbi:Endoribonuclease YBEY, chloroplastic [Linum perenne]
MLEILPLGTSKGSRVEMLLDHLETKPEEIMAIGDEKNDKEMLELAGLGIALSNGADKTKAVANFIRARAIRMTSRSSSKGSGQLQL